MTTFGEELKKARDANGMSQRALAKALGDGLVTGSAIGQWERGEHEPGRQDRAKVTALEKALDVPRGTLLATLGLRTDGDGDGARPQSLDEREDRIAEALVRLAEIQAAQTEAVVALQAEQAAGTAALLALVEELRSRQTLPPGQQPPAQAG